MPVPKFFPEVRSSSELGQIVWGQALYSRDGASEIQGATILEDGWNDVRILKLASLMELFCLSDCSLELIEITAQKGYLQSFDVEYLMDLLISGVFKKPTSHRKYRDNFEKLHEVGV